MSVRPCVCGSVRLSVMLFLCGQKHRQQTNYDTRSLSPRKCSANIHRTSSFLCIAISKPTIVPKQLFLHHIRLLKPFSISILQCKIKWEMEKMWTFSYERISDCNPDHLRGKNRICIENKKIENLKTSRHP